MTISAKVIKDTCSGKTRLITLEVEFHRFILPEVNTHRSFSRNYSSSRAIPVQKMIDQVYDNPAIPVHWGKNQAGMQAEVEQSVEVYCHSLGGARERSYQVEDYWSMLAQVAGDCAQSLNSAGYHKQIVNRILEPFMWTKGVITATEDAWNAFFALRIHRDAQPEIMELAKHIKGAIDVSFCEVLSEGEWHLPYIDDLSKFDNIEDAIKVSTSACAQVSYRVLDTSLDKAKRIYELLNLPEGGIFKEDPAHMSPCEHIAMAVNNTCKEGSGNFQTKDYSQYRKALEMGVEKVMFL